MAAELRLERLRIRTLRNIEQLELDFAPRLNVIAGDNGQGKTSVLEAIYAVATSRSFRTERLAELISDGQPSGVTVARVRDAGLLREQRLVIEQRSRHPSIDGKRPRRLLDFATKTPVVVFHPADLALVSGSAQLRRTLLDRLALFREPASAEDRKAYSQALRSRQQLLDDHGTAHPDLEIFETLAAKHGALVSASRRRAAADLALELASAFTRLAASDLELEAGYLGGGTEDETEFRKALAERRREDRRRGRATFGPQRDDLELQVAGRSARKHASQGQQRVLTLALKSAELACLRAARGVHPVLLLDDVSSELDPGRTGAVYRFLQESQSQIFLTTTRPDLFQTPDVSAADRADFRLAGGRLQVA